MKSYFTDLFLLALLASAPVLYGQSVNKYTFSCYASSATNDSIVFSGGELSVGQSASPKILIGYLPLDYSLLSFTEQPIEEVLIYPNPITDVVNLFFSNPKADINISVYTISGDLILCRSEKLISHCTLDLNDLSSGIYLLKLLDSSGAVVTKKLIRQ